jgi:hypothetical protein
MIVSMYLAQPGPLLNPRYELTKECFELLKRQPELHEMLKRAHADESYDLVRASGTCIAFSLLSSSKCSQFSFANRSLKRHKNSWTSSDLPLRHISGIRNPFDPGIPILNRQTSVTRSHRVARIAESRDQWFGALDGLERQYTYHQRHLLIYPESLRPGPFICTCGARAFHRNPSPSLPHPVNAIYSILKRKPSLSVLKRISSWKRLTSMAPPKRKVDQGRMARWVSLP